MSYEAGMDFLLKVYVDSEYVTIAGQRNVDFSREVSLAEVTNKSSSGHREYIPTLDGATFEMDQVVDLSGDGWSTLNAAFIAKTAVQVQFYYPDESTYTASAYITKLDIGSPHDAEATAKMSIQVTGAVTVA